MFLMEYCVLIVLWFCMLIRKSLHLLMTNSSRLAFKTTFAVNR